MKILIFGNICSGKSYLGEELRLRLQFQVLAIDDFRRRYGDGTWEGEKRAQAEFYEAIKKNENQIIETLGVGHVTDNLIQVLLDSDERILCIKMVVKLSVLKERLKTRIWDVPFPKPISEVLPLMLRTHERIKNQEIEKNILKLKNCELIVMDEITSDKFDEIVSNINKVLK